MRVYDLIFVLLCVYGLILEVNILLPTQTVNKCMKGSVLMHDLYEISRYACNMHGVGLGSECMNYNTKYELKLFIVVQSLVTVTHGGHSLHLHHTKSR